MTSPPMAGRRDPTNRELDAAFLSRFLTASGLLADSHPIQLLKDPPDFWVQHRGRRISIELTRIYTDSRKGSTLREGESNRRWVCGWLEDRLAGAGVRPVHVSLTFSHDGFTKRDRVRVAAKTLDLVRANEPPDDQLVELDWRSFADRDEYGTTWPEELDSIRLLRPRGWDAFEVTKGEAAFLAAPKCFLEAAIEDKEKDRPRYQRQYDETWLVAVAEGMGPSSLIEADEASRNHPYRFAFDRVFFFEDFGKRWFELLRAGLGA